jgi:hypothetical protein
MGERIYLAANNPDLGGGEQMLVRTAEALRSLGREVCVVAPDTPADVLDASAGVADVVAIRADGRRDYIRGLRSWDRTQRRGLLWCHGLVPAFATSGRPGRIVHLHQDPRTPAQHLAARVARHGALATLVPSRTAADRLPGSTPHPNWTQDLTRMTLDHRHRPNAVGYLGRLSTDKGVDVLARAMTTVVGDPHLLLAGDTRYVDGAAVARVDAALDALGPRAVRLGHVDPQELLRRVAVVVFPSVWAEPFGLVAAEAMAAGVPFVISDAGALPEVAGADHPWVARAGDATDLSETISRALSATPDELADATDGARRRWEREYSPDAGRERVRRLLEELGAA